MSGRSPYLLPDGNVQIAFSGGRTSAYMLHQILEANGDLPERVEVTFQNTGREMPETLDFVAEVGRRWGVMITWLEYRPEKPFFEIVGHQGASRNGEPFAALIERRKYLPNQQTRFCTTELKIRTAKRYLRSLGWERWTNCVGIRADEPDRLNKPAPKDRWTVWHPLATAGITRRHVSDFWRTQPFDLRLPNVNGNCWLGNCDGCFLKSEANVAALARDYPERHAWWEAMEARASDLTSGSAATFSKRYSRREVREFVERHGDWIFETEGALCQADGGECMG
jgi:3'-phosphoadenosine 5'-phosphosulfate sulfotransferase (PAPS reductase)/FAD synthetase